MRQLQGLLPYALASVAVVVASAIALGSTVRGPLLGPAVATATAERTPLGSRATLSESARMAYWRSAQSGQLELWVSDLDGGRRWTIATAGSGSDVALTRWAPDGNALAYVVSGQTLAISRLDGSTAYLDIPGELGTLRWRIVSYEWSPDSSRVAATLRAAGGLSNVSDVYLVSARAGAIWERVTLLSDAFAGKWISPTQLFIEEAGGALLTLDVATRALRPITGMPVTSAQIGRDGRVYFVGGQFVTSDVSSQPYGNGWVWSATIDGEDLRREVKDGRDNLRLFGTLADGRPVVGVPGGVYVVGDAYVPLAFQSGTVRRVVVSPDGKRVVGMTDQRILVVDPAKLPRAVASGGLPPAEAATVLLSSVREADVWFPARTVTPVRSTGRASEGGPNAKLAFVLGRAIYRADPDGTIHAIATEQSGGFVGVPRWSPAGDRVAAPVSLPAGPTASVVLVTTPAAFSRWEVPTRFPQGLSWTADGKSFVIWSAAAPRFDEWTTQLYDADTGRPGEKIAGRATYAGATRVVLGDGTAEAQGIRFWQPITVSSAAATRTITDAKKLSASPLLKDLPDPTQPTAIFQVSPSADGGYVAVWLTRLRGAAFNQIALVVVRTTDGEPVWVMPLAQQQQPSPSDVTWSSSGHLLGWWTGAGGSGPFTPPVRSTVIVDPTSGRTLQVAEGRFAGWSDGPARSGTAGDTVPWFYVARDSGLFAYAADGSGPVKIGPIGVPVSATRP